MIKIRFFSLILLFLSAGILTFGQELQSIYNRSNKKKDSPAKQEIKKIPDSFFESLGDIDFETVTFFPVHFSNFFTNRFIEKGQKNIKVMEMTFYNTNRINNFIITNIYFYVKDHHNKRIIPQYVIGGVRIRSGNATNVYADIKKIIRVGDYMSVPFNISHLYVLAGKQVRIEMFIDITKNVQANEVGLEITHTDMIKTKDVFFNNRVLHPPVNCAYPFQTDIVPIIADFKIYHDSLGYINEWEKVVIRVQDHKGDVMPDYRGVITLFAVNGSTNRIKWTNLSGKGFFNEFWGEAKVMYHFVEEDHGVITLQIQDSTFETLDIVIKNRNSSYRSNFLQIVLPVISMNVIKEMLPAKSKKKIMLHTIIYSNATIYPAENIVLTEYVPERTVLISDSAEISNHIHEGNVKVYYATNIEGNEWFSSRYDTRERAYKVKKILWEFDTAL
ncbi:MAG: hypothetical protein JW827_03685, partial [Spirochaetes bacterium]|nr:hypothetical protein [Spirochaetota bacterium]